MTVTIQLRVESVDPRMTGQAVSDVLGKHFWLLADDLTGVLTYGGSGVSVKPVVSVESIVVREAGSR